jgi:LysR family transcriptional regulator, benzoate and cis,cis-muconate-responsive activator of ben and cat genes
VTSATYGPLPDVIRLFRRRFPGVELRLQNLRSVQQRQALVDRRIDVGFVRPQGSDPRLIYEALWRESVIVALPGNHPLTRRTIVDVPDLATEPFVVVRPEESVVFNDEIFARCRKAGFTPRVGYGVPDEQAASALVAAGLGISLVPAAIQGFKRKGVVYRGEVVR